MGTIEREWMNKAKLVRLFEINLKHLTCMDRRVLENLKRPQR
jgi:hypothetical protein